jgi:hypothetical protein
MKKRLRVPFVGPKMIARLARLLRKQRKETAQSQEVESSQNQNKSQNQYGEYLKIKQRIETSNNLLQERELIEVKEGGTGIYEIKMKLKGIDLGRKYKSWLIPSGLWFAEYKDHWFWLILGFLGGIIGALLVN